MRVKLTRVNISNTNKEGQAYLDKNSRPYNRVSIQTDQHGKTWLGGLAYQGDPMLQWKIGQEVEIEPKQNGQYWNFTTPKPTKDAVWSAELVEKLFTLLQRIEDKVDNLELVEPDLPSVSPDEISKDEIPNIPF